MRWAFLAGVVLLSLIAVATTFVAAPHNGGDNAGYVTLAHSLLTTGTYTEFFDPAALPHTKYPPVFPLLLAGLMAMGVRTWVGLKMVAAASTVAAVIGTWLWAERRVGTMAASAVAAVLAVSSGVVYYSHWILSDPTFLAFTVLALWALERADAAWRPAPGAPGAGTHRPRGPEGSALPVSAPARESGPSADPRAGDAAARPAAGLAARPAADPAVRPAADPAGRPAAAWLALGVFFTVAAYFTRSAGLPLVVAVLAWLAWRRRWIPLGLSAAAVGIPALIWWLRARAIGGVQYVNEFWMVDPYDPSRGTVGPLGLVGRMLANAGGYVTAHVPAGLAGPDAGAAPLLGMAVVGLGIFGWVLAARRRVGPVELFAPLYTGLILLWPEVWSGDRFALPLLPLLFLYGAVAVRWTSARWGRTVGTAVAAVAFLAAALPAAGGWIQSAGYASACADLTRTGGPFACYGPGWEDFAGAAGWARTNLPEGSSVLTRKPRLFYVLSEVPGRTFPFVPDADSHLDLADQVGARYELLDQVDGLATAYVGGALQERAGAYCVLAGFGTANGIGTRMLGILPGAERVEGASTDGTVQVGPCAPAYIRADSIGPGDTGGDPEPAPDHASGVIPLLERRDP